MANKVSSRNEIFLNGKYYPTERPVQSVLASIYPGKVVIGDTSKDSQLRSSIISWSDWRGGIGIDRMEGGEVNRAWWSNLQLRYKNHLVLGNLGYQTHTVAHGQPTAGVGTGIATINEFNDFIYAVWNGSVNTGPKMFVFNPNGDHSDGDPEGVWWDARPSGEDKHIGDNTNDAAIDTVTCQVVDSLNFTDRVGTNYLIVSHYDGTGTSTISFATRPHWTGSTNHANWDQPDTAISTKYLASWDDRLWGISHEGQLWYSIKVEAAMTATNDAVLPLPDGYCTGLFVARSAQGEPILYVASKQGLWAHDAMNSRFVKTELEFPFHPHGGKGADRWRDSIYYPSGLGLYKYVNGSNSAVLSVVGPDRDDGLPSDKRGTIMLLEGTHNELLAAVDSTTNPSITSSDSVPYQWGDMTGAVTAGADFVGVDSGYSSILGYNELGWETKWLAGKQGRRIDDMHVSNAYSDLNENYRLWWGFDDNVYYMKLPVDIINPSNVVEFEYAPSGELQTPWFNAGQNEIEKLALQLKIETRDCSSTETVIVEYATDYNESTSSPTGGVFATITSDGITEFDFNSKKGTTFSAIRFKITLARATSGTNYKEKTPDVVSTTLIWRKKMTPKYAHQVAISLNRSYKGYTPKQLREFLKTAIASSELVEFTFRDDDGTDRNYYVDIASASGIESTGYDERGSSTIMLVEP